MTADGLLRASFSAGDLELEWPKAGDIMTGSAEAALREFLVAGTPRAWSLSGRWGTGKTTLWKRIVAEFQAVPEPLEWKRARALGKTPRRPAYGYVSLYSIGSIEELRTSIGLELSREPARTWRARSLSWIGRALSFAGRKLSYASGESGNIGRLPISPKKVLSQLFFWRVAGAVICIDDIERRGSGLSIKDIMALTSYLVEERSCRVLIIFNRDSLSPDDLRTWEEHSEKVLDAEIIFSPTPSDAISIGLAAAKASVGVSLAAAKSFHRLDVDNIRIIVRTAHAVDHLMNEVMREVPSMSAENQSVIAQAASVLYVLKLSRAEGAPTPTKAMARNWLMPSADDESATEKLWWGRLRASAFYLGDDMNSALLASVEAGFPQLEKLVPAVSVLAQDQERERLHGLIKEAWDSYHGSFQMNDGEVFAAFEAVRDHIARVESLTNLQPVARILRATGRPEAATALLKDWVGHRQAWGAQLLDADDFGARPTDTELLALIHDELERQRNSPTMPISIALDRIDLGEADEHSIRSLLAASTQAVADEIIAKPRSWRKALSPNGLTSTGGVAADQALKKLEAAFDMVANYSELNRMRVGSLRASLR